MLKCIKTSLKDTSHMSRVDQNNDSARCVRGKGMINTRNDLTMESTNAKKYLNL